MKRSTLLDCTLHGQTTVSAGSSPASELLLKGEWHAGCVAIDRVLANYPRDALALQVGHLMDFTKRHAEPSQSHLPGDAALGQIGAWLLLRPGDARIRPQEMNQYPEAEASALRALAIQPKDGWAVHAAVHVMEMQGRIDEGIAFLSSREADWAPGNGFAYHNFWHLALFHMDGAHYDRALDLFDRHVHPQPAAYLLSLIDATALLWRLRLEGVNLGRRMEGVADDWETRLAGEAGFYAFNDAHGDRVRGDGPRRRAF